MPLPEDIFGYRGYEPPACGAFALATRPYQAELRAHIHIFMTAPESVFRCQGKGARHRILILRNFEL